MNASSFQQKSVTPTESEEARPKAEHLAHGLPEVCPPALPRLFHLALGDARLLELQNGLPCLVAERDDHGGVVLVWPRFHAPPHADLFIHHQFCELPNNIP